MTWWVENSAVAGAGKKEYSAVDELVSGLTVSLVLWKDEKLAAGRGLF